MGPETVGKDEHGSIRNQFFSTLHPCLTLHHFRHQRPFHLPMRRSPEYVILLCWSGHAVVREAAQTVSLFPGEIMITNPGVQRQTSYQPGESESLSEDSTDPHRALAELRTGGAPATCEGAAVMLSRELMGALVAETGLLPCGVPAIFRGKLSAEALVGYAKRPLHLVAQRRNGIGIYLDSWLRQFVMEVLWSWHPDGILPGVPMSVECLPRPSYIQAIEFMFDCGKESFSVEALSRRVGMSGPSLRRRLVESANCSPLQLYNGILLHRAKEQLRLPDVAVKSVAYSLGFPSHSQFSHFFRRMAGCSPAAFQESSCAQPKPPSPFV